MYRVITSFFLESCCRRDRWVCKTQPRQSARSIPTPARTGSITARDQRQRHGTGCLKDTGCPVPPFPQAPRLVPRQGKSQRHRLLLAPVLPLKPPKCQQLLAPGCTLSPLSSKRVLGAWSASASSTCPTHLLTLLLADCICSIHCNTGQDGQLPAPVRGAHPKKCAGSISIPVPGAGSTGQGCCRQRFIP